MPLSRGDKVGRYEILGPIGAGGMGQVFRAKDSKLGRQVAIKVLPPHLAANAEARERLRREAQAAALLDHPFICKVFEIAEVDGALFLVMEFVSGETLFERLCAGRLPLAEALRLAREIGEALEEAHKKRFLHRDLKPANVMVTQSHVKVMDFGLARQFNSAAATAISNESDPTIAASPALTERGVQRVQKYLDGADLRSKITLLTMALLDQFWSGNVAAAAITLARVKDLHQAAGIPVVGLPARVELLFLWSSGQFARVLELAPRAAAEYRRSGDQRRESEIDYLWLGAEISCGHPSHAAAALPDTILRAERTGHLGVLWALKSQAASLTAARGDLAASEREMREAWEFGQAHGVAWSFSNRDSLADYAFYRGDLAEAEQFCSDPSGMERKTYHAGIIDSARFSLFGRCGDNRATKTWARRSWQLPVVGQLNSQGSWRALIASKIGLASIGRKAEAALLRPLTQELLLMGAWQIRAGALCQTVAGIAAACAGDFTAAEEHHLTAVHQADIAPYKQLQPIAREWYAAMLLERSSAQNTAGDAVKGRAQLQEAVNMYEAMSMTYPAKLASKQIAAI